MSKLETIKVYKTANFRVTVDALEEDSPDLSWDETGEVAKAINDGILVLFCARVRVEHFQLGIVAEDYLGNCIYKDAQDFIKNSGYFVSMIHDCCHRARVSISAMRLPAMRLPT